MDVLGVVTVVAIGLMVGVEFAVAVFVNPIFDRLPGRPGWRPAATARGSSGGSCPSGTRARSSSPRSGRSSRGAGGGGPRRRRGGAAGRGRRLSITLLVPINDRVKTWSAGDAPADWRAQVGRWDRLHHARVALLVVAFALVAVGLLGV